MKEISFTVKIYDNVLEIIPDEPIESNSAYEINIEKILASNGITSLKDITHKTFTRMTPSYCSIEGVQSLVEAIDLPDDKILYYIRESSRKADYLAGTSFDENNPPFQVNQFVKYRSAHDTLLRYSIDKATTAGLKGVMGEIQFETGETGQPLANLLKYLKAEADKWETELLGEDYKKGAKPKAVVKSSSNIYATRLSGFGRESI